MAITFNVAFADFGYDNPFLPKLNDATTSSNNYYTNTTNINYSYYIGTNGTNGVNGTSGNNGTVDYINVCMLNQSINSFQQSTLINNLSRINSSNFNLNTNWNSGWSATPQFQMDVNGLGYYNPFWGHIKFAQQPLANSYSIGVSGDRSGITSYATFASYADGAGYTFSGNWIPTLSVANGDTVEQGSYYHAGRYSSQMLAMLGGTPESSYMEFDFGAGTYPRTITPVMRVSATGIVNVFGNINATGNITTNNLITNNAIVNQRLTIGSEGYFNITPSGNTLQIKMPYNASLAYAVPMFSFVSPDGVSRFKVDEDGTFTTLSRSGHNAGAGVGCEGGGCVAAIYVDNQNGDFAGSDYGYIQQKATTHNFDIGIDYGGGALTFSTYSQNEHMRIAQSAITKVGIGSANPQYTLDVNGTIWATNITVGNLTAGIINTTGNITLSTINNSFIRMYSPNGSLWKCGVNNTGSWLCS